MHELKLIQHVLEIIEQEAQKNRLSRINKIVLKIGKLRQYIPDYLKSAFQTLTKETLARSAEIIIEEIAISAKCKKCDAIFAVHEQHYVCPFCQNAFCDIITGNEIILETIEGTQHDY